MSARSVLLVCVLWVASLALAYRVGSQHETNKTEAAKVPVLVQAIQTHDAKASAAHQVEVKSTRAAAKTEATFQNINDKVLNYAQTHAGRDDCGLDADGLRLWQAANANADPAAEDRTSRRTDSGLPGSTPGREREGDGTAGEPRPGGEALPRLPGAAPWPGRVDGGDPMTDIVDLAGRTEEEARAVALLNQSSRAALDGKTVADSAEYCSVCEIPIPQQRREAVPGVETCIDCQAELEQAMRQHTRGRP